MTTPALPMIGGLPRAGSTLLSALLRQNPRIEVTPTGWLLGLVSGMTEAYTDNQARVAWTDQDVAKQRLNDAVAGACRGYLNAPDSVLTVEKARGALHWFETLTAALGEPPRLVLPVRDLRGCISSMERIYRRNPEQQSRMEGAPTVQARGQKWLHPESIPLGRALAHIHDGIQRGVIGQCLVVRYEDLAQYPLTVLRHVYAFFGLEMPENTHSAEHVEQTNREHDAVHGPIGDHEIQPGPVHYDEPAYNDVLGIDVAAAIVRDNQWFYQAFYPELLRTA